LVRRLALQGYRVAALARREEELNYLRDAVNANFPERADSRVLVYPHDVTDYEAVPALFQDIVRDLGGLDLIVYGAAVQPAIALNEYNFEKDAAMIEVNLLGAIAWLNQAAMRFERARRGHIVGISSIAGDRGRVGGPVYNASKAGLNTYLEALRNRLARRGVTVTTIKPGFVDTKLLANAKKTFWVISPEDAAAQIYLAVLRKKGTVYIPKRWGLIGLIIRHIPSFIFKWMNF
jgi:NAD(P)-dependent dehydrogenase (short-subunit alcohol dehydrogenase family)